MSLESVGSIKLPEMKVSDDVIAVGKDYLLYIALGTDVDSAPDWEIIGGQRSGKLNFNADEIDASHKTSGGWKDSLAGLRGWGFDGDSVVIVGNKGANALRKAYREGKPVYMKFENKSAKDVTIGWMSVVDLSLDTSHTDVASMSIKLNGKGAPKFEGA